MPTGSVIPISSAKKNCLQANSDRHGHLVQDSRNATSRPGQADGSAAEGHQADEQGDDDDHEGGGDGDDDVGGADEQDISSKIHFVPVLTTMIMMNKPFCKTSKEHETDCVTTT